MRSGSGELKKPIMSKHKKKIAFLPVKDVRIPRNLREYYVSKELIKRGWGVLWLLPDGWTNYAPDLDIEWEMKSYNNFNIYGHKYISSLAIGLALFSCRVNIVWISGWKIRDPRELIVLIYVLKRFGIKIIYDTIDPIMEVMEEESGEGDSRFALYKKLMANIYVQCDVTLTVTPEIRRILVDRGVPAEKVYVARWGTDLNYFNKEMVVACDWKERMHLKKSDFLVGWLGTMGRFRGLDEIIVPLIRRLHKEQKKDIHFILAGKGPLWSYIRELADREKGLPLTVLGTIPYHEAASLTYSLDAYLIPTNPSSALSRAIVPIKLFDALSVGTDAIITETDAVRTIARQYTQVYLTDFSVAGFHKSLMHFYNNRKNEKHIPPPETLQRFSQQQISIQISDAIESVFQDTFANREYASNS